MSTDAKKKQPPARQPKGNVSPMAPPLWRKRCCKLKKGCLKEERISSPPFPSFFFSARVPMPDAFLTPCSCNHSSAAERLREREKHYLFSFPFLFASIFPHSSCSTDTQETELFPTAKSEKTLLVASPICVLWIVFYHLHSAALPQGTHIPYMAAIYIVQPVTSHFHK